MIFQIALSDRKEYSTKPERDRDKLVNISELIKKTDVLCGQTVVRQQSKSHGSLISVLYCSEADNLYEKCISSTDIVDSFPKRKVYILTMHQRSTVQKK